MDNPESETAKPESQEFSSPEAQEGKPSLLYVVAWLLSVALILVDMGLLRAAGLEIMALYSTRAITTTADRLNFNFLLSFVERASLFIMVIVALGLAVVLESHYRTLAKERALLRKGWKPLAILIGIGLLSLLVRFLL
jgi:hypothetical protein